jgi:D-inositol-3-phosphate glycosyltransferase
MQPLKGLDVAIATLGAVRERHPGTVLVAVGGPSGAAGEAELARCRELAGRSGLTVAIRWVAPQPHHMLSTFYRAADVVLVPSRSESFGLVALEAAACGVPVVAAAVGGLTSNVQDGTTGLLVEGRDPAAYARAVTALLDQPDLARTIGDQAATAARAYTWSMTAARLRRLYSDLTKRALVDCAA